MYIKTIKYPNMFDGHMIEEDFYFNLSKREIVNLQYSRPEGFDAYLKKIMAEKDAKAIFEFFTELIRLSVGQRSEDGRRFVKSPQFTEDFMLSNAGDEFLFELLDNNDTANEFVRGIMPASLIEEIDKAEAEEASKPQPEPPSTTIVGN